MKYNLHVHVIYNRYLPTKTNRKAWILEKEVKSLILQVVKERKEKTSFEKDMLKMIIEGAKNSNFTKEAGNRFIIDSCRNIYLAGFESNAVTATWCLMLLASNQNWQDHARAEVLEICKGKILDFDMLSKMKLVRKFVNLNKLSKRFLVLQSGDKLVPKIINIYMTLQIDLFLL